MQKKLICLITILILSVGSVFAQNTRELSIGSVLNGNLSAGQEIWYSVRTTEAGILTVETIGYTDTYLEAYDAQRNLITENDDGDNGANAKIELVVTANTNYLFKLRGYSREVTGAYRIYAAHDPMPRMTELRANSFLNGNISYGEQYWFSVRAVQNGLLVVETTGDTDTLLEARDENFSVLYIDDDSGEELNARVEIDVKAGKTYYFKLWAYDNTSGSYRIMANNTGYPVPTQLNPGSFVSGNISPGGKYWYSVRTARSGTLVVETTGNIDTYLDAYTDSYDFITSDDDGGEGYNARIEIPVEANRTYIFKLRGYDSETSGSYRIFASFE